MLFARRSLLRCVTERIKAKPQPRQNNNHRSSERNQPSKMMPPMARASTPTALQVAKREHEIKQRPGGRGFPRRIAPEPAHRGARPVVLDQRVSHQPVRFV